MLLCFHSGLQDSHPFMKVLRKQRSLVYGTLSASDSFLGQVAALARSRINGSILLEKTIEKTTETMPLSPNQYQLLPVRIEQNRLE